MQHVARSVANQNTNQLRDLTSHEFMPHDTTRIREGTSLEFDRSS